MLIKKTILQKLDSFFGAYPQCRSKSILIAVSGGPDSLFLLFLLNYFKKRYEISLMAAYYNHSLRSQAEQDQEEKIAQKQSQECGINLIKGEASAGQIQKEAEKRKMGLEEAARYLRYQFLKEAAEKQGCSFIALGHHQDDFLETMLMRFFQGSSAEGLRGILAVRDKYIRPLLSFSKAEILDCLKNNSIEYCIDQSNQNTDFLRNRLRSELLPLCRDIFPGMDRALLNLADKMQLYEDYLEDGTLKLSWKQDGPSSFYISRRLFFEAPPVLRLKSIYALYDQIAREEAWSKKLPYRFIKPLLRQPLNNKIQLCGHGISISSQRNLLFFRKNIVIKGKSGYFIIIKDRGSYSLDSGRVQIKVSENGPDNLKLSSGENSVNIEQKKIPLIIQSASHRNETSCPSCLSTCYQVIDEEMLAAEFPS